MEFQDGGHGGQVVFPNGANFESNLAKGMRYHQPPIGGSVFELKSGYQNVDGQTDVGHINLIGGWVTCNPPNKTYFKCK